MPPEAPLKRRPDFIRDRTHEPQPEMAPVEALNFDFDGYTVPEALEFFGQDLTEFEKMEL
jgi:hypothetical protein